MVGGYVCRSDVDGTSMTDGKMQRRESRGRSASLLSYMPMSCQMARLSCRLETSVALDQRARVCLYVCMCVFSGRDDGRGLRLSI